jgi:hypothetical protein
MSILGLSLFFKANETQGIIGASIKLGLSAKGKGLIMGQCGENSGHFLALFPGLHSSEVFYVAGVTKCFYLVLVLYAQMRIRILEKNRENETQGHDFLSWTPFLFLRSPPVDFASISPNYFSLNVAFAH